MKKKYFILPFIANLIGLFSLTSVFAMDTDQSKEPIVKSTKPTSPKKEEEIKRVFEAQKKKIDEAIKRVDKRLKINKPLPINTHK